MYNFLVHRKRIILVQFRVSGESLHILENSGFVWGQIQNDQKSDFYMMYSDYFWKIKNILKDLKEIQFLLLIIWKIINSEVRSRPHQNFFEKFHFRKIELLGAKLKLFQI